MACTALTEEHLLASMYITADEACISTPHRPQLVLGSPDTDGLSACGLDAGGVFFFLLGAAWVKSQAERCSNCMDAKNRTKRIDKAVPTVLRGTPGMMTTQWATNSIQG